MKTLTAIVSALCLSLTLGAASTALAAEKAPKTKMKKAPKAKADASKDAKEAAKESEAAAAPAVALQKLPKFGLQADFGKDVTFSDGFGESVMVTGGVLGAMSVEIATEAKTLDQGKEDADLYSPQNVKAEELSDGWLLTFENDGGFGKHVWVMSVRKIGDKHYSCGTTASTVEQQTAVANACRSLQQ